MSSLFSKVRNLKPFKAKDTELRTVTLADYGLRSTSTLLGCHPKEPRFLGTAPSFPHYARIGDVAVLAPSQLPWDANYQSTVDQLSGFYKWDGTQWVRT